MFCPKCGTENKDTARFCKNCGQPLVRKAGPARAPKKMPWPIGILALAMLCVVAIVVIYPRFKGKLGLYASVYGTYINQDNPDEYLELKEDGTFYLKEMGVGFTGEWEIEEDVLTLSFPQVGLEVKSKLKGDTITDEEGKTWVRKGGKRITPITPAPSPGAIVPRVLTITNPEMGLSGVRVYDSRDAPRREGHIFLVSGREAVVIEGPAVSKSAGIDVASLFKLENERVRKVAHGQLSTSDEDGYIVWINPHLCFEIAIEDWEGEVALAEVALTRDQDTIKSRFTFRAQEERGGLLSGEITALVDGVIVGHSRLPGIEVRPSREPEVIVPGIPTSTSTPVPPLEPSPAPGHLANVRLSDTPDGPAMTQFTSGTAVVHVIFDCADMQGERIKVRVYDNYGGILFQQTQTCTESGTESVATTTSEGVFPDGRYVTNFYRGEYVDRTIIWEVGEPVARPIATPTSKPAIPTNPADRADMYSEPPEMQIDTNKTYVATISTAKGDIVVQLDASAAPLTVNNFVFLARQGFYNKLTFHRVEPRFVIQGGDPTGTGAGGPGYTIPAEIQLPHVEGAIAMARKGDQVNPTRASSGSQFYITLAPTPFLDEGYTAFGHVIEGMDVVQSIAIGDMIDKITASSTVEIARTPQRFVSLAPSNTEILFALGLGDRVVGVTDFCDYPEEAQAIEKVGGMEHNLEKIVALDPDLVLAIGGSPAQVEKATEMEKLGLTVLVLEPGDIEGIMGNIELVGKATGAEKEAGELVAELRKRFGDITAKVEGAGSKPKVFFELDATDPSKPYTPGPGSFIDALISLAGGSNIGASAKMQWAQLSTEEIIAQDPEVIVLGDANYGVTAEMVKERPGWSVIAAVKNGAIYPIDDILISRPGPRIIDGLETLAGIIHPELTEATPSPVTQPSPMLIPPTATPTPVLQTPAPTMTDPYCETRKRMVEIQIRARGVTDEAVLTAMEKVPRHEFVPPKYLEQAYADHPLPIGYGQTISQPFIVAWMTELLELEKDAKVLEIGTGSGYQAAILAEITDQVYTLEIIEELEKSAEERLKRLGYAQVKVRHADGYFGWEEYAPYDAIIVTCAPDHIPQPLIQQLKDGGRMVLPVGPPGGYQSLWLITKQGDQIITKNMGGVRFVPLQGEEH